MIKNCHTKIEKRYIYEIYMSNNTTYEKIQILSYTYSVLVV